MRPRQILPEKTYMITRRTSERRFFMRPSKEVNQAIEYCLARAAKRARVRLHLAVFLSNHYHIIVTDPEANLPVFTEELNKLIARCLNCLHGRFENFWAGAAQTSHVELATPEDVLAKCCYAILNPVKDGLVKSWRHWPGLVLTKPGTHTAHRPTFFFREEESGGALPAVEKYELVAPPIADGPGRSMQTLHDMVRAFETQIVSHRKQSGLGFLGAARIRNQSFWDSPESREPRFQLSPRVACRDKWRRIEVLRRHKTFVKDHRVALSEWRSGNREAAFPVGTYLMRILHAVRCALVAPAARAAES